MAKAQYPKTVGVPEALELAWRHYQRLCPSATFSGTVCRLLADYLETQGQEDQPCEKI